MKPSRSNHDQALRACQNFSGRHPQFDARAKVEIGSAAHNLACAFYRLNDVAGSWATNENCRVTPAQFHAALALLDAA